MACTGGFVRTGWMAAQAGTERLRGRGGLLYAGVARGAPRPCWAYSATRGRPRSLVCAARASARVVAAASFRRRLVQYARLVRHRRSAISRCRADVAVDAKPVVCLCRCTPWMCSSRAAKARARTYLQVWTPHHPHIPELLDQDQAGASSSPRLSRACARQQQAHPTRGDWSHRPRHEQTD